MYIPKQAIGCTKRVIASAAIKTRNEVYPSKINIIPVKII